jgi:hypothetical protein
MKARHFAPVAPLHTQPAGPYATPGECEEVLSDALRGVVLGGYDELICGWLVQSIDFVHASGRRQPDRAHTCGRHPRSGRC